MKCQKCYHDNLPGAYLCSRCGQQLGDRHDQTSIMVDGELVNTTCAYNDHGTTCTNRGTLSPSTTGKGPWYCFLHASVFLHDRATPRTIAEHWQSLKATLQAVIRRRQPGED